MVGKDLVRYSECVCFYSVYCTFVFSCDTKGVHRPILRAFGTDCILVVVGFASFWRSGCVEEWVHGLLVVRALRCCVFIAI